MAPLGDVHGRIFTCFIKTILEQCSHGNAFKWRWSHQERSFQHSVHMETLLNGDGRTRSVAWEKKTYFLFAESIFIIESG